MMASLNFSLYGSVSHAFYKCARRGCDCAYIASGNCFAEKNLLPSALSASAILCEYGIEAESCPDVLCCLHRAEGAWEVKLWSIESSRNHCIELLWLVQVASSG